MNEGVRVERIESLDEARDEWSELADRCPSIFSTWEWAEAWWRTYGAGALELRACRTGDGRVAAILPLYRMARRLPRVLRFLGHGPADQLGPVCAPADLGVAIDALRDELDRSRALDVFLADRTPNPGLVEALGGTVLRAESNHVLRFDGDFDEFLRSRSSNFRQQVRRRERRLTGSGQVRYRLADAATLQDDMTTLFRLHHARWGEEGSSAFEEGRQRFHRAFAASALARGWLRLWMLELDGEAVAAWYGFRYAGAEWYYQSGRDPSYERQSVGFVLLLHTVREALNDGLSDYHLLRGDEQYKSRLANAREPAVTFAVSRPPLSWGLSLAARSWTRLSPKLKRRARRSLGER